MSTSGLTMNCRCKTHSLHANLYCSILELWWLVLFEIRFCQVDWTQRLYTLYPTAQWAMRMPDAHVKFHCNDRSIELTYILLSLSPLLALPAIKLTSPLSQTVIVGLNLNAVTWNLCIGASYKSTLRIIGDLMTFHPWQGKSGLTQARASPCAPYRATISTLLQLGQTHQDTAHGSTSHYQVQLLIQQGSGRPSWEKLIFLSFK